MSNEQWFQILLPPANFSVLFGLVLVLFSRLFIFLTEQTVTVDAVTVHKLTGGNSLQHQQEAKEHMGVYTRDAIWRVVLLTSTLSSCVSLFAMMQNNKSLSVL